MIRQTRGGHNKLHGIQIGFSDGSNSPLFQGFRTKDETTEIVLEIDAQRTVKGISFKQWEDNLTGLRIFDENGDYLVDYTWQANESSG